MRNLVKTYTFTAGTRQITVEGDSLDIQDIRLIVNETQNKIIASSMKKANILSVTDNVITFSETLPVLATNDVLTIEIDNGVPQALALAKVMDDGLAEIVTAVNNRGGNATVQDSYHTIATKIGTALLPAVNVTPMPNHSSDWHDLFEVMASVYDPTYPYMYSLLLDRNASQSIMDSFVDGEVVVKGGHDTVGKITRWVVFKRSTQNFSASYNVNYRQCLIGCALYNAEMTNVSFYGSKLSFYLYNNDFNLPSITFNSSQFRETALSYINTPLVDEIIFTSGGYQFHGSGLSWVSLNSRQTTMSIANYAFQNCAVLSAIKFPSNIIVLSSGINVFYGCGLKALIYPNTLKYIAAGQGLINATFIEEIRFPNSLEYLTLGIYCISGNYIRYIYLPNFTDYFLADYVQSSFATMPNLTTIELGINWKWALTLNTSNYLTRDCLLAIFNSLVDKRKDGVNSTTCSTVNGSKIVTFTNGNCLNVFVANGYIKHAITIGATTYTIATVDNDNQITLTANATTNTNVAYGINRTLTLGATNLARVSVGEIAVATDKGWTIA